MAKEPPKYQGPGFYRNKPRKKDPLKLADLDKSELKPKKGGVKAPTPAVKMEQARSLATLSAKADDRLIPQGHKNQTETGEKLADQASESSKFDASVNPEVQLALRYRIPKKLKKLDKKVLEEMASWVDYQMRLGDSERTSFLSRLVQYRDAWNNFLATGMTKGMKEGHDVHIPLTFEKIRMLHARIYQAVVGVDPIFTLRPKSKVAEELKQFKEDLLRWAIMEYANKCSGWIPTIDKDIWNFIADGTSVVKHSWCRDVRKFVDVETKEKRPLELDEHGRPVVEEKEIERESIVYDGPMAQTVPLEDIFIVGNYMDDINDADLVVHRQQYSRSDVLKSAKIGFFDSDAVDRLLASEPTSSYINSRFGNEDMLKYQTDYVTGIDKSASYAGIKTYVINEAYFRYDIDDDGIDEELVAWISEGTNEVLRITYLERVGPGGRRPFVLKKLIPREQSFYGVGLAEILFGLNNEMDMLHNMRLDYGTLQNLPFGFYRAASGLNPQEINLGPGKLIPVDDPQSDISFPRLNGGTAYGFQEEQMVKNYADDASGLTPVAMGSSESQGASRTATGASILANAANAGLDVFIRRYQEGFKKNLEILDLQLRDLLPLGTVAKIVGMDGKDVYRQFESRDQIAFDAEYCLEGNSQNSNKLVERDVSLQMMQLLSNPLYIQTGLVQPKNLYNAVRNVLQKFEYKNIDAFVSKPEDVEANPYTGKDELSAILAGVRLPKTIQDKHAEKLAFFQDFENSDDFGILDAEHLPLYQEYKAWHEQMAAALDANANNPLLQNQLNPAVGLSAQLAAGSGAPAAPAQQIMDLISSNSQMAPGSANEPPQA